MTTPADQEEKASTLAQWKKRKVHTITLPSGALCDVRLPNIPKLVESGQIPNELVEVASLIAQGGARAKEITGKELLAQHVSFTRYIVAQAVVEPDIKEDEVADLPYEDQEFIVEVATRNRDIDAAGRHIGGLHTQASFRAIRGIPNDDEGLAGL